MSNKKKKVCQNVIWLSLRTKTGYQAEWESKEKERGSTRKLNWPRPLDNHFFSYAKKFHSHQIMPQVT
uniref:Uncharacterized protein n=1 Tax=Tetranychus urticae TaxID=32264 RepID=T1KKX3_TETUR